MTDKSNTQNLEDSLNPLINFIKSIPKPKEKMVNADRYTLLLNTTAKLQALLMETEFEGTLTVGVDNMFNIGYISVEMDDLSISKPDRFAEIVSAVDNFEVYPLTNGKLKLDITFQGVLYSIY